MTEAPALAQPTRDSLRLRESATEAFRDHVLPAIRRHLPAIEDRIAVVITSSVAYGAADQHSDLDMFIMFERERDYLRHVARLQQLIDSLDLSTLYGEVCDKGMRFEIESLQRADLSALFHHPERRENWHRQSEWLLTWFLDSYPIHDPAGIHARLLRRAGHWPADVLQARKDDARTRIVTWSETSRRLADQQGLTLATVRSAFRSATASLELAYLDAGRYAPHPKWRSTYAEAMLGGNRRASSTFDAHRRLAGYLALAQWTVPDLEAVLLEHSELLGLDGAGPAVGGWASALEHLATPYTDDLGTIWVAKDRAPGNAFHKAAREAARAGEVVYLASELGSDRVVSRTYDGLMRTAEPFRWLAGLAQRDSGSLGVELQKRRWRFVNFVIWRKLRVVDKAAKRCQVFTCRWYQLQVIDQLLEALAMLEDGHLPPLHRYGSSGLAFLKALPFEDAVLRPAALVADVREFLTWGWREFGKLQDTLVERGLLNPEAAQDPLATQWEIQYWKYENLFI
ncbi:hypothetical protein [Kitasatospora sp. NPDC001175]|uniref:hypothetical protein n=1 Tax=Kitasatospora sp. NPDC001175 TaxID=3157103 RepID=UPI003D03C527